MGRVRKFAKGLCILNAVGAFALLAYCAYQSSVHYYGDRLRLGLGPPGRMSRVAVDIADSGHGFETGSVVPNCGVPQVCPPDFVAVRITTAARHKAKFGVCISGVTYLETGLNGAGRGINVVVADPSFRIISVRNFDTYESTDASAALEKFLLDIPNGDLAFFVTFDEPSRHLTRAVQKIITGYFGSAQIHNLGFRSHWYLVGRKNMIGLSPYEKLGVGDGRNWGPILDDRFCISANFPGMPISPDPILHEQRLLNNFCFKHNGFDSLCNVTTRRNPLLALPLKPPKKGEVPAFRALRSSPALNAPIVVIGRRNPAKLGDTLKTLLYQIGLRPANVFVLTPQENRSIFSELAGLFGFHAVPSTSVDLWEAYEEAFEVAWNVKPDSPVGIFLEEGFLLSPEYLSFLTETVDVLLKDDSLLAVSGFNPLAVEGLVGDGNLAYRVESFPGLGFMLRKDVYLAEMKGKMQFCCRSRPEDGWLGGERIDREILVPGNSRIMVTYADHSDRDLQFFAVKRSIERSSVPAIANKSNLTRVAYEKEIKFVLQSSMERLHVSTETPLSELSSFLTKLRTSSTPAPEKSPKTKSSSSSSSYRRRSVAVVSYSQTGSDDVALLSKLCEAFGLVPDAVRVGSHRGMLRFGFTSNFEVFLVGSASEYYKLISGSAKDSKDPS